MSYIDRLRTTLKEFHHTPESLYQIWESGVHKVCAVVPTRVWLSIQQRRKQIQNDFQIKFSRVVTCVGDDCRKVIIYAHFDDKKT